MRIPHKAAPHRSSISISPRRKRNSAAPWSSRRRMRRDGGSRVLLLQLGRLDEAVALAQRAIALDPLRIGSHFNLATYLTALGRYDEAEAAMRKAIELQPQSAQSYMQLCDLSDPARQTRRGGGIGETGNRSVLADLCPGAGPLCQRRPGRGRRGPEKTDRRKRRTTPAARSLRSMPCARNRKRCSSGWSTPGRPTTQV